MRYVPYKYLPVDEENDHCQSSIVNYEKIKDLKCLVRPEKKDKTEHLYKKSLNIRKVKICEMHSTFL